MYKIYINYREIKKIRNQILNKYKNADKNAIEQILFKIIYPNIDSNLIKETLKIRDSIFNDCFSEIKKSVFKDQLKLLDKYRYMFLLNIIDAATFNEYILNKLNEYGFKLDNIDYFNSFFNRKKRGYKNNPISYNLTDYLRLFYILNTEELKSISVNDINKEQIEQVVNLIKNKIQGNEKSREIYFLKKMEKEKIIYKEGLILKWINEDLSVEEILIKIKNILNEEIKMKNNYRLEPNIEISSCLNDGKNDFDLDMEVGKNTCIIGHSGCGKTVLACRLMAHEINKGNNFLMISIDLDLRKNLQYFINKEKTQDVFYTTAGYLIDNNKYLKDYFDNNKTVILNMINTSEEKNKIIDRLLKEIEGTETKIYIDEIPYIYNSSSQSQNQLLNKIKNIKNDSIIVSQDSSLIDILNESETNFIFGKTNDTELTKDYNGSLRDFYDLKVGSFIMKRNDRYKRFDLDIGKDTSMDVMCNSPYFNLVY